MSEIPKLTKGERRALAVVYAMLKDSSGSTWTCTPNGIQFRTMENLHYKKMLKYERGTYGDDRWRLTPEGYETGETLLAAHDLAETLRDIDGQISGAEDEIYRLRAWREAVVAQLERDGGGA